MAWLVSAAKKIESTLMGSSWDFRNWQTCWRQKHIYKDKEHLCRTWNLMRVQIIWIMNEYLIEAPSPSATELITWSDHLHRDQEQPLPAWSARPRSGRRTPGRWTAGSGGSAAGPRRPGRGGAPGLAPELRREPHTRGTTRTPLRTRRHEPVCSVSSLREKEATHSVSYSVNELKLRRVDAGLARKRAS